MGKWFKLPPELQHLIEFRVCPHVQQCSANSSTGTCASCACRRSAKPLWEGYNLSVPLGGVNLFSFIASLAFSCRSVSRKPFCDGLVKAELKYALQQHWKVHWLASMVLCVSVNSILTLTESKRCKLCAVVPFRNHWKGKTCSILAWNVFFMCKYS